MNLAKAPSLSLIVLFVGLLLSVRNQWRYFLSFFYVWMYGGFPLLFVVTGVVAGVSMAKALLQPADFKQRWRALWRHPQWKSVGAVASGMLAGVVVNPFFPNNLAFYWQQTVQIGLINYQTKIGVGREWYPYAITDLIPQTIFVSIFVLVAMVFFVLRRRQQPTHHIATGVLALGFFLLVLKSRRYIEYYVPFAILWSALVISETIVATGWKRIWNLGRNFFEEQAFLAVLSVMVFLIFPPIIIVRDFFASHNIFVRAHAESRYAGASKWLRNTRRQTQSFSIAIGMIFPRCFTITIRIAISSAWIRHSCIKILRSTAFVAVTKGTRRDGLYEIISGQFHAEYVLVENDHDEMTKNIRQDPHFEFVYKDSEATIWRVGSPQ